MLEIRTPSRRTVTISISAVRTKTLRTHRIHPSDDHVQLPSLGLINDQDKTELGAEIEETKQELIRERTRGFGKDPALVRQGYRQLELLVKALHKQLSKLLGQADAVDLSELAEIGDEAGGISSQDESEILVFEKLRKRRRATLAKIQRVIAQLDRIQASYKKRLQEIKDFEKLERIGLEPSDEVEPTVESEMMKEGVTFADVAALNIEEPEILAPTEDLEKMKQGVSFADVVSENLVDEKEKPKGEKPKEERPKGEKPKEEMPKENKSKEEKPKEEKLNEEKLNEEKPKTQPKADTTPTPRSAAKVVASKEQPEDKETAVLAPTEDLELMKDGVTFADITKENIEEPEVLAPTEDLELMKEGVTFADIAKQNVEEPEVLAPTEDLELMKEGVTFADIAKENIEESEVLAPTEDLKKMKQGFTFADAVNE
ncbi:hypothetical protein BGX23_011950 [Mortierella sp. AD031]|nr:hypothetical protein BGX23_011950 [Mortierella sp. AD031]